MYYYVRFWIWYWSWTSTFRSVGRNITSENQEFCMCCNIGCKVTKYHKSIYERITMYLYLTSRNLMTFFNLKNFPLLVSAYGIQSAFAFYASVLTANCIVAYFIVPETRGKSLTELSQIFEKKESKK